jgi:hypothetical protein
MDEDSLGRSTEYQDMGTVFSSFVRLGFVTDVNNDKRIARVKFEDLGYTSGWIPVLINRDFIPDYDVPQRTEFEAGGSGDPAFASHKHDLIIKPYMPKKGEQVLCLYEPVRNGRGYILGGIQPWQ